MQLQHKVMIYVFDGKCCIYSNQETTVMHEPELVAEPNHLFQYFVRHNTYA